MTHGDHPEPLETGRRPGRGEHRGAAGGPGGRDPLLHRRGRTNLARERDLAHERRTGRRRDGRGGRHQRGRDREVARRVVDPNAARHRAEQLRPPERDAGASLEHRRHLLEAPEVEPGHLAAGGTVATPDQRLDLDRQRPAARQRQRDRGAGMALSGAQQLGGIDRGQSPAAPIWNQAVSPSVPKRFFPPETIRSPERGSPSNVRTTSTACSSARGPARSPSFVTWPASTTAMSSCLGELDERVGARPDLRHAAGLRRGLDVAERLHRIDREHGRAHRPRGREHGVQIAPRREGDRLDRDARGGGHATATCPRDSSPETSRPVEPAAAIDDSHCSNRVDLPIPGGPASSTTEPATRPPPEHSIEIGEARRDARRLGRPGDEQRSDQRRERGGPRRAGSLHLRELPPCPAARAAPRPLGGALPAGRAHEPDARLRHRTEP